MEIKFYDCNQENLEKVYSDYVNRVKDGEGAICTNILCMVPYTKPKLNNGIAKQFIKTKYKLMTSTLLIEYREDTCYGQNYNEWVEFIFGNISMDKVVKFAKMEDIDWNKM